MHKPTLDARITRLTTIDGRDYLAIDGRGMFWTYAARPFGAKTWRLLARLEGDRIVFTGGAFGDHSIAAEASISSAERVEAHWRGYVQATERKLLGRAS